MIGLHARLSVFQVTAVSMCTQKQLTFKISNLQLFKLPITNSSPFKELLVYWLCRKRCTGQYLYQNQRQKGSFSYEELRYSGTELTFPNMEDFFAKLHHPFVLNKLAPKSWVANGFPISFQTLILEKFMLHQYFKQHYMHQKFKREISNPSFQVQGSWQGNLEVFTKWKRKWVGHVHFRREIRLHNAS